MHGIIYKATNKINGKIYIGQTINTFYRRIHNHLSAAKNHKDECHFHNALKLYGEENFDWEIIEEYDMENIDELFDILDERERSYIKEYNSTNRQIGYNIKKGGRSAKGSNIKYWNSEEGKQRKKEISTYMSDFWSNKENVKEHIKWMCEFYETEEGMKQAERHSQFMSNYYSGQESRKNKAKTSRWFVKATSPSNEEIFFISSKEPNLYFGHDISLRCFLKNIGDVWIPSRSDCLVRGWKFEAIEKDDKYFDYQTPVSTISESGE